MDIIFYILCVGFVYYTVIYICMLLISAFKRLLLSSLVEKLYIFLEGKEKNYADKISRQQLFTSTDSVVFRPTRDWQG
jgi:hypothetical protein